MSLVKRVMAREMLMVALAASLPAAGMAVEYQGAPAKKPARHGSAHGHNAPGREDRTPTTTVSATQPGASGVANMQNTVSSSTGR